MNDVRKIHSHAIIIRWAAASAERPKTLFQNFFPLSPFAHFFFIFILKIRQFLSCIGTESRAPVQFLTFLYAYILSPMTWLLSLGRKKKKGVESTEGFRRVVQASTSWHSHPYRITTFESYDKIQFVSFLFFFFFFFPLFYFTIIIFFSLCYLFRPLPWHHPSLQAIVAVYHSHTSFNLME